MKPLPNSPARAASIEPLIASMLVWIDTVLIEFDDLVDPPADLLEIADQLCCFCWSRRGFGDAQDQLIDRGSAGLHKFRNGPRPASSPAVARRCESAALFSISIIASARLCAAAADCCEPLLICSIAAVI